MKKTAVAELSLAAVFNQPENFDFGEGYSGQWEYVEAGVCSECGKVLLGNSGEEQHCNIERKSTCEGYVHCEGPMMNYYYPLDDSEYLFTAHAPDHGGCQTVEDAAMRIAHLPLCIVQFGSWEEPKYALALTGGGMNLAWEIAEAYICLGYTPPEHICGGLPDFAGMQPTKTTERILTACARTAEYVVRRGEELKGSLARTRQRLEQNAADRAAREREQSSS